VPAPLLALAPGECKRTGPAEQRIRRPWTIRGNRGIVKLVNFGTGVGRTTVRTTPVHDHDPDAADCTGQKGAGMRTDVAHWLTTHTTAARDWPIEAVLKLKARSGLRVGVVLPALNEAATVGQIVTAINSTWCQNRPGQRHNRLGRRSPGTFLVDDLLVLDSGSTDATARIASATGARLVHRDDVLPRIPAVTGKGEALWRAVAASDAEILVFCDADLRHFEPAWIPALVGPLLADADVSLVKGYYDRPAPGGQEQTDPGDSGGRVTELVARPLLNLFWPQLAGVVQPLGGEYAARRSLLEQLSFPVGYGVELALLIDTHSLLGLPAIAQVDLGRRLHRHQSTRALGRMSAHIMQAAANRLDPDAFALPPRQSMLQFAREGGDMVATEHDVSSPERPPLATVPEYAARAERAS